MVSGGVVGNSSALRILLVDDQSLVRAGVRSIIESSGTEASVVEVATGEEGIAAARTHEFDLVFMEIELPGQDGFSSALSLLQLKPGLAIVLMAATSNKSIPKALLQSGLSGCISKAFAADEIGQAMHAVREGRKFFSPEIEPEMALAANESEGNENPFDALSERELQVVLLLIKGFTTGSVSKTLSVSSKTVSTYKSRAFIKLGVQSTAELVTLAISCGLIKASAPKGT